MLQALPMLFVLAGLALYMVLGGADFGAGFWQLFAGRGPRAERVRWVREREGEARTSAIGRANRAAPILRTTSNTMNRPMNIDPGPSNSTAIDTGWPGCSLDTWVSLKLASM